MRRTVKCECHRNFCNAIERAVLKQPRCIQQLVVQEQRNLLAQLPVERAVMVERIL